MERTQASEERGSRRKLVVVKLLHTNVWALMVVCIVILPILGAYGRFRLAAVAASVVLAECLILFLNGWKCPMTGWAGRYTEDRRPNRDIYLPGWLAQHTKIIFGILFIVNIVILIVEWRIAGSRSLQAN